MTDRINSLLVALETDVRVDDIGPLIMAIQQLKGVIKVDSNVTSPETWIAQARIKLELRNALYKVLED